jgi:cyanophycin synthetase
MFAGFDLVVEDITAPMDTRSGGIVEINAAPGIRMHHYPTQGQPRDVGAAIVDMLYPQGPPTRIPVISITGTNGKTTVTRMIGPYLLHRWPECRHHDRRMASGSAGRKSRAAT